MREPGNGTTASTIGSDVPQPFFPKEALKFKNILIEISLICNIILISGVQHSDSVVAIFRLFSLIDPPT